MQNETIQPIFSYIRTALQWAPDWLAGILLLIFAAGAALLVHALMLAATRRTLRSDYTGLLLAETRNPTRAALVVFALGAALPVAPFEPEVRGMLSHLLVIAFVVLLGWIAHVALKLASDLYLRRFREGVIDNMLARKHITQVAILRRAVDTLIVLFTIGAALMTFEPVRQFGLSLFASAGVAGLVVGLAARPVLANLIAGFQIAMTQPIRIDDVVNVEDEWGRVREIGATYVVLALWDERDMVVPLSHFIEKPFQNWTRTSTGLIGTVLLYADYTAPVAALRARLDDMVKASPSWDGRVAKLDITECREATMQLRAIVSARNSADAWKLRCEVREKLIDFLQREHPTALPRQRTETVMREQDMASGRQRTEQA